MPVPESSEPDLPWMIDAAVRLQSRYSNLIRKVHSDPDALEIVFYIEDLAMECAQELQAAGVANIHRLSVPRNVALRLDVIRAQRKERHAIQVLEDYLLKLRKKQNQREDRG